MTFVIPELQYRSVLYTKQRKASIQIVKRILAIILITVITGDSIRIGEWMKLPNLRLHFTEHQSAHPGDTLFAFLLKHYNDNQRPESEQDKKSDSSLPFKSPQNFHSNIIFFVDSALSFHFVNNPNKCVYGNFCESVIPSDRLDIWQPPKLI